MTGEHSTAGGILFTDQYQLTMAQLYFTEGMHRRAARFDYFFRSYPDYGSHRAGFCILAGLDPLLEWMEQTRAVAADIDYLRSLEGAVGSRVFGDAFLEWLEAHGSFAEVSVQAVLEGRVVHPHEPLVSVQGPLAAVQLLETSLLNHLNYPTLIATKAARVARAARGGSVLEFGMRRGPGSGADAGARAALIGGCDFTSNVGVSREVGLDPKGTHAHSMVQAFLAAGAGELEAFRAYARAYPDDCLLLVDTVDTLESGLPNALIVFDELRDAGHEPVGIRLDSGDLAELAIESARRLDAAGYTDARIVLSSDLDEHEIASILDRIESGAGAAGVDAGALISRLVYGVGTRLITSQGDPSLGGVYKLSALETEDGWRPVLKRSDDRRKMPIPGRKRLWRLYGEDGTARADLVGRDEDGPEVGSTLVAYSVFGEEELALGPSAVAEVEELLEAVYRTGSRVGDAADISTLRARRTRDLERLPEAVARLVAPEQYPVVLGARLKELQRSLLAGLAAGDGYR